MPHWYESDFANVSAIHRAKHSSFWNFLRLEHFKPFQPFLTVRRYNNGQKPLRKGKYANRPKE
jgi:hypothetical protein